MELWMLNVGCVFLLSIILSGVLIPKILLISFKKRLFDDVDERKIHTGAVPRLGGLVFNPVIFFSIVLVIGFNAALSSNNLLDHYQETSVEMAFEYCGLTLLYMIGIADDLIGVRYSRKFIVQIGAGILLIIGGVWIDNLHGLLGIYELPRVIGYLLTILVIVFFTNAINLIDGIDGLASGLSIAALVVYSFSFVLVGYYLYAALALAALGVLLPFFYYNVFGNAERGRKIFMGDTGSLTLGFILSFLSLKLVSLASIDMENYPNSFVLAFSPLMIPCFDVVRVFFGRIRRHKNPFLPDKTHIHHKLLAMGLSPKITMTIVVGSAILLTFINVELSKFLNINLLVFGNIFIWILLNMWMSRAIARRRIVTVFKQQ